MFVAVVLVTTKLTESQVVSGDSVKRDVNSHLYFASNTCPKRVL